MYTRLPDGTVEACDRSVYLAKRANWYENAVFDEKDPLNEDKNNIKIVQSIFHSEDNNIDVEQLRIIMTAKFKSANGEVKSFDYGSFQLPHAVCSSLAVSMYGNHVSVCDSEQAAKEHAKARYVECLSYRAIDPQLADDDGMNEHMLDVDKWLDRLSRWSVEYIKLSPEMGKEPRSQHPSAEAYAAYLLAGLNTPARSTQPDPKNPEKKGSTPYIVCDETVYHSVSAKFKGAEEKKWKRKKDEVDAFDPKANLPDEISSGKFPKERTELPIFKFAIKDKVYPTDLFLFLNSCFDVFLFRRQCNSCAWKRRMWPRSRTVK